jgi:hypothetical protein
MQEAERLLVIELERLAQQLESEREEQQERELDRERERDAERSRVLALVQERVQLQVSRTALHCRVSERRVACLLLLSCQQRVRAR